MHTPSVVTKTHSCPFFRVLQILHETRERPETQAYLDDLKNMRKVRRLQL